MDKINTLTDKRKWQWGFAMIISLTIFSLTFFTIDINFATNDDNRIMYALAGYNTGSPYPYHPFINYFLGLLISSAYEVMPSIPWYGIFHVLCLFVGFLVIGKCCFKMAVKSKKSFWTAVVVQLYLFYALIIFPVVSMQFSTTPAVLGIAGVALILCLDTKNDKKKYIYLDLFLAFIFLLLCFMTRSFTWYCVMCFYTLAVVYQFGCLRHSRNAAWKKWAMVLFGSVFIVGGSVLVIRGVSLYIKAQVETNKDYTEYNEYRTEFQDYIMRPEYVGNEEFYKGLGWSENTYRASLSLQFLDEEMNTENLKKITTEYKKEVPRRSLYDTWETAREIFDNNRVAKTGIASIFFLFILCIILYFIGEKRRGIDLLSVLCTVGGFFLMFLYLAYRGRLPIRTFMVITISAVVFLALLVLKLMGRIDFDRVKPVLIVGIFCGFLLMAYNFRAIYLTDECTRVQTRTTATVNEIEQFEQYALDHNKEFFLYDFTVATLQKEPFIVHQDKKPINCMVSGGSYTFSTLYYKQLEENGLSSLYWEDLLRNNVYYVSADIEFVELAAANIQEKTGKNIRYEIIEEFGEHGVKIYKFNIDNETNDNLMIDDIF